MEIPFVVIVWKSSCSFVFPYCIRANSIKYCYYYCWWHVCVYDSRRLIRSSENINYTCSLSNKLIYFDFYSVYLALFGCLLCHQFHSKLIKINFYTFFSVPGVYTFLFAWWFLPYYVTHIVEIFFCFDPENNFLFLVVKIIINPSHYNVNFFQIVRGNKWRENFHSCLISISIAYPEKLVIVVLSKHLAWKR